jgi:D-lactate dehydrogenase
MQDRNRVANVIDRLKLLPGLDEATYLRLLHELDTSRERAGLQPDGLARVTLFDAKARDVESFDKSNGGRFLLHYVRAALSLDTARAAEGSRAACIFVNDTCDAAVVERLAELGVKLIALRCAGFNHVDIQACARLGVQVVRVPAYSPYAVAEFTIALMMVLNRRIHHAYARNRTGNFVLDGLTGFDMHGKTVGVVGTGKIGQCVVDILLGFGCQVLAFDKFPHPPLMSRPGVQYVDLSRLFAESDIITLHVPLFTDTHYLINRAAISQMKPGVMLVNTSRGGLIDSRALIEGLKTSKIGSAALDVYEEEAGIFFHDMSDKVLTDDVLARLMTFNNVIVTSHQAFLTREALANIADTTLANIEDFIQGKRGKELSNVVLPAPV